MGILTDCVICDGCGRSRVAQKPDGWGKVYVLPQKSGCIECDGYDPDEPSLILCNDCIERITDG